MLKVYISSPVSHYQRIWNNEAADLLRKNDFVVLLPQEISPKNKKHVNFEIYVYEQCIDMIQQSDFGLLLLPYGRDCAWEAGYYKGINKPFFLFASKLDKGQIERLRDWMVKGGLYEIITDNKETYDILNKDSILKHKSIHKIPTIKSLPEYLSNIFQQRYLSYSKTFIGVGAVVVKNNKVLLVQEKKDSEFYYRKKGMWGFPTQRLKPNTDPRLQSLNSLKEESNLQGSHPEFLSVQNIPNAVGLFYTVDVYNPNVITNGKWVNVRDALNEKVWLRPTYINVLKDL